MRIEWRAELMIWVPDKNQRRKEVASACGLAMTPALGGVPAWGGGCRAALAMTFLWF